jgi:hypothetical protein
LILKGEGGGKTKSHHWITNTSLDSNVVMTQVSNEPMLQDEIKLVTKLQRRDGLLVERTLLFAGDALNLRVIY